MSSPVSGSLSCLRAPIALLLLLSTSALVAQPVELSVPAVTNAGEQLIVDIRLDEASGRVDAISSGFVREIHAISEEALARALTEAGLPVDTFDAEWIARETLVALGITVGFNAATVSVELEFPAELRGLTAHRAQGASRTIEPTIEPADVAAGINLFNTLGYDGGVSYRLDAEVFANLFGWVAEYDQTLATDRDPVYGVNAYRVLRDVPAMEARVTGGTLAYPLLGFQGARPIVGVGAYTVEALRDGEASSRRSVEFLLDRAAEVELRVDGRLMFREQLPPGPHRIDGLALSTGSNEIELLIDGEQRAFTLNYEPGLLPPGRFEWSVAAGVEREALEQRLVLAPSGGAYLRYGATAVWTPGAFVHADSHTQMLGLASTLALGETGVSVQVAGSRSIAEGGATTAQPPVLGAQGRLKVRLPWFGSLVLTTTGRTPGFTASGPYEGLNPYVLETNLSFSHALLDWLYLTAGANASVGDAYSAQLSGGVLVRLPCDLRLRANLYQQIGSVSEPGTFFALTVAHSDRSWPVREELAYASRDQAASLRVTGDQILGSRDYSWNSQLATEQIGDGARYRAEAGARHSSPRLRAGLTQSVVTGGAEGITYTGRTNVDVSIVQAGGTFGVGAPVRDAFAVIDAGPGIEETGLRLGGVTNADWYGGFPGPPIVEALASYRPAELIIDTLDPDPLLAVESVRHGLAPAYRSGYLIPFALAEVTHLDGRLLLPDGRPAAHLFGRATRVAGDQESETIVFFTEADGRFQAIGLTPGVWLLDVGERYESLRFTLDAGSRGVREVGEITVQEADR